NRDLPRVGSQIPDLSREITDRAAQQPRQTGQGNLHVALRRDRCQFVALRVLQDIGLDDRAWKRASPERLKPWIAENDAPLGAGDDFVQTRSVLDFVDKLASAM